MKDVDVGISPELIHTEASKALCKKLKDYGRVCVGYSTAEKVLYVYAPKSMHFVIPVLYKCFDVKHVECDGFEVL